MSDYEKHIRDLDPHVIEKTGDGVNRPPSFVRSSVGSRSASRAPWPILSVRLQIRDGSES
jgi:hypothetical protein